MMKVQDLRLTRVDLCSIGQVFRKKTDGLAALCSETFPYAEAFCSEKI